MVNKEHPLFSKYKQEWDKLWADYSEKSDAILPSGGQDCTEETKIVRELHKGISIKRKV